MKNPKNKTHFLTILFCILLTLSCKKNFDDSPQQFSPKLTTFNEENDSSLSDAVIKASELRNKFVGNLTTGNDNYSMDSGIWYLTTSLNIDLCNANTYGVDAKYFTHQIDIDNVYSFTENTLKTYFTQIKNLVIADVESVTQYNDKALKYLIVNLKEQELTGKRFLSIQYLVGHKYYQDSWTIGEQAEYEYFNPSNSYRFNNNGGYCSDKYFAPLDWRLNRFKDIHGDWRGHDYGGASDLEKAINISYNYEVIRRNGNNSIAYPIGKKPIFTSYTSYTTVNTDDVININNTINSKLNPSNIFSYNDFSMKLNDNLPCVTGAQLNYFLSRAINDILFTPKFEPPYASLFTSCYVRSNYKPVDASIDTSDTMKRSTAKIKLFNVGGSAVDEFYSHYYILNCAKVSLVVDSTYF